MTKLCILGASSFVGNAVYNEARKRKYEVIGTQNANNKIDYIKYDLCKDSISDLDKKWNINSEGKKYLLIASAIASIDKCKENIQYSYSINVIHTERVIEEAIQLGYKIIFLSSEAVFDGKLGDYSEADAVNPVNEYGRQKVQVENHLRKYEEKSLILRISRAVDIYAHNRNILYEFETVSKNKKTLYCIRNQMFTPTYVGDIAKAICDCIDNDIVGVYHLAADENITRADFARMFSRIKGFSLDIIERSIEDFKFMDERAILCGLNGDKLKNLLSFSYMNIAQMITQYK